MRPGLPTPAVRFCGQLRAQQRATAQMATETRRWLLKRARRWLLKRAAGVLGVPAVSLLMERAGGYGWIGQETEKKCPAFFLVTPGRP